MSAGLFASFAFSGMMPSCFWRAKVSSRYLSQPPSNWPLNFAIHSFGTWCGACVAPVAKYVKKGLSGVSDCWARIQLIAWLVMSVVKW